VHGKNPLAARKEDGDIVLGPTTCPRWSYGASTAVDFRPRCDLERIVRGVIEACRP
jgi:hypothetical protein